MILSPYKTQEVFKIDDNDKNLDKSAILKRLSEHLQSVEREAIMHTVIECMHRNDIGIDEELSLEKLVETMDVLIKEEKIHFIIFAFPKKCFDEIILMEEEGTLKLGKERAGETEIIHSLTIIPGTELAKIIAEFI